MEQIRHGRFTALQAGGHKFELVALNYKGPQVIDLRAFIFRVPGKI